MANSPVVSCCSSPSLAQAALAQVELVGAEAGSSPRPCSARPAFRAPGGGACTALMRASSSRGLKGLANVVVGAHLQAHDAIHVLALGGEHDDGASCHQLGAQAAADGQAVFARHHQVEHDEIDGFASSSSRFMDVAVFGQQHLKAFLAQVAAQQSRESARRRPPRQCVAGRPFKASWAWWSWRLDSVDTETRRRILGSQGPRLLQIRQGPTSS